MSWLRSTRSQSIGIDELQQFQGIVTGSTAEHPSYPFGMWCGGCRGLGDQIHDQRRIHGGLLPCYQIGKPLHVLVEPFPDLV